MQIFLKTPNCSSAMEVQKDTTVGELQHMIDNEHFIPVGSQYLVAQNGIMSGHSDSYLSDFGVEDQDSIELMLRVQGGTKGQMRGKWKKKRMRRLRRRRRKMRQRAK
jgi:small subunit ribosomal protein S27Ae